MKTKVEKQAKNIPELRFPGFEGEWRQKTFQDVAKVGSSKRVLKQDWKKEGVPFYRTREVVNLAKGEDFRSPIFISEMLFSELEKKYGVPKPGDLLVTGVGTIGNSYLVQDQDRFYFKDGNVLWFSVSQRSNSNFLNQLIKTRFVQKQISDNASITTVATYTIDDARKTKIIIPEDLEEQQKIASFLSLVDEWIENLKAQKEAWEQYKKGMMQKIFSQEIRFKDENGKDFPDWEEKKLGEIAMFLKGKGISKQDIVEDGEHECIRYGELYTEYGQQIDKVVSRTDVSVTKSVMSKKGDVLIPSSGETAVDIATASAVLRDGVVIGGDINIVRTKSCDGVFLASYLSSYLKYDIAKLAQGNSVVHLYSSSLKGLKLSLPNVAEQKKIAGFLSVLDEQIEATINSIEVIKNWKKGLMQKMFI